MDLTINAIQKFGSAPKISQRQNIAFSDNNSNNSLPNDTFAKENKQTADNLVQTDIFYRCPDFLIFFKKVSTCNYKKWHMKGIGNFNAPTFSWKGMSN